MRCLRSAASSRNLCCLPLLNDLLCPAGGGAILGTLYIVAGPSGFILTINLLRPLLDRLESLLDRDPDLDK